METLLAVFKWYRPPVPPSCMDPLSDIIQTSPCSVGWSSPVSLNKQTNHLLLVPPVHFLPNESLATILVNVVIPLLGIRSDDPCLSMVARSCLGHHDSLWSDIECRNFEQTRICLARSDPALLQIKVRTTPLRWARYSDLRDSTDIIENTNTSTAIIRPHDHRIGSLRLSLWRRYHQNVP